MFEKFGSKVIDTINNYTKK